MMGFIKRALKFFGHIIFYYALLLALVFFFQRNLMYHPNAEAMDLRILDVPGLEQLDVKEADGLSLRHWFAPPKDADNATIVFFMGNTGGLETRAHKYRDWAQKGYGVLLVGYRGFGNPGKPTEEGLYADARAAIDSIVKRGIAPETLVLYGESLGTGIATQMALDYSVQGLILEAPYTSFADAGAYHYPYFPVHWLIKDHYQTLDKIGSIEVPLLVLHGDADQTVPFEQGKRVFEAAPQPKTSFFVPKAGHNDLYDFGAGPAVIQFLETL